MLLKGDHMNVGSPKQGLESSCARGVGNGDAYLDTPQTLIAASAMRAAFTNVACSSTVVAFSSHITAGSSRRPFAGTTYPPAGIGP